MNALTTIDHDLIHVEQGSVADWAGRIASAWQRSVSSIFEAGRLIADAKAALPHGAFTAMIESDLPFGARTAQMLMRIGEDARLSNPKHVSLLPPSWGTLYELTKLKDDELEARFSSGAIRPDMERREVGHGVRATQASRHEPADSLDYFPTPPWATRALIEDVLRPWGVSLKGLVVLEPACGEGHITSVLQEYGPAKVTGTDIFDYSQNGRSPPGWSGQFDFLDPTVAFNRPDWVITNSPFSGDEDRALAFALRALVLARKGVAMFVRTQWLEGINRYETLFAPHRPALVAQFAERVSLFRGAWDPDGSKPDQYCWVIWRIGKTPHALTTLQWIPPGRRMERSRPDDVERFTAHPVLPPSSLAADLSLPSIPSDGGDEEGGVATAALPTAPGRALSDVQPLSKAQQDAIIRKGYRRKPMASIAELMEATGLGKSAVKMRAQRMNLSDPKNQKAATVAANKRRKHVPLKRKQRAA
jgi:hypothetical protein